MTAHPQAPCSLGGTSWGGHKTFGRIGEVLLNKRSSLPVVEYFPYNSCYVCCNSNLNLSFSIEIVEKHVTVMIQSMSSGVRFPVFKLALLIVVVYPPPDYLAP